MSWGKTFKWGDCASDDEGGESALPPVPDAWTRADSVDRRVKAPTPPPPAELPRRKIEVYDTREDRREETQEKEKEEWPVADDRASDRRPQYRGREQYRRRPDDREVATRRRAYSPDGERDESDRRPQYGRRPDDRENATRRRAYSPDGERDESDRYRGPRSTRGPRYGSRPDYREVAPDGEPAERVNRRHYDRDQRRGGEDGLSSERAIWERMGQELDQEYERNRHRDGDRRVDDRGRRGDEIRDREIRDIGKRAVLQERVYQRTVDPDMEEQLAEERRAREAQLAEARSYWEREDRSNESEDRSDESSAPRSDVKIDDSEARTDLPEAPPVESEKKQFQAGAKFDETDLFEEDGYRTNSREKFKSFDDMGLKDDELRGVYAYGFEYPSVVQARTIPHLLKHRDVIAQSQSGTGKTAAYVIPLLNQIDLKIRQSQVLILTSTREIAAQIRKVVAALGDFIKVTSVVCVGGSSVRDDMRNLVRGPQIIVGSPGRIGDMMNRNCITPKHFKFLVLDEADQLLSVKGRDQVYDVFMKLPSDICVALFSTTYTREILDMTCKFMREPFKILVPDRLLPLEGVKHYFVQVTDESQKVEKLLQLFKSMSTLVQAYVFCNTHRKVDWLSEQLKDKASISCHHGDLPECDREVVLKEFRSGDCRLLITSDLLSRGVDVQQVNFVIHYDIPQTKETYLHRVGRTGRFGRAGSSVALFSHSEMLYKKQLESTYGLQMKRLPSKLSSATTTSDPTKGLTSHPNYFDRNTHSSAPATLPSEQITRGSSKQSETVQSAPVSFIIDQLLNPKRKDTRLI